MNRRFLCSAAPLVAGLAVLMLWQTRSSAQSRRGRGALRGFSTNVVSKDLELRFDVDVKARSKKPPMFFDDKGRPRKPTDQELQELRGSDHLPGYQASFSDLHAGQVVKVFLSRKKLPRTDGANDGADAKTAKTSDEAKPSWKKLGDLTGVLVKVNGPDDKPARADEKRNKKADTAMTLVLRVEGLQPGRRRILGVSLGEVKNGHATPVGDDVYVRVVEILVDAPEDKK